MSPDDTKEPAQFCIDLYSEPLPWRDAHRLRRSSFMGARWNSANKSPFASASQNRIRVIPQSRNAVDSSEPRNSSKLASPAYHLCNASSSPPLSASPCNRTSHIEISGRRGQSGPLVPGELEHDNLIWLVNCIVVEMGASGCRACAQAGARRSSAWGWACSPLPCNRGGAVGIDGPGALRMVWTSPYLRRTSGRAPGDR